jgi:hypothetical protein
MVGFVQMFTHNQIHLIRQTFVINYDRFHFIHVTATYDIFNFNFYEANISLQKFFMDAFISLSRIEKNLYV